MPVNPARVRQARLDSGFSLAELAGGDVSRAFLHQVERGLSRPSSEVLDLIAERTGRPADYFTDGTPPPAAPDLSEELAAAAARVDRLAAAASGEVHRQALGMAAAVIRDSARIVADVLATSGEVEA